MGKGAKFSEDGSKIVTWCGFGFSVWDAKTNTILYTVTGHEGLINYAEFNHKGTAIVTASEDNTAKIWNAKNGKLLNTLQSHKGWVCYAKFNVTDDRIISLTIRGRAILWNANTGDSVRCINDQNHYVREVNFSSDGKLFAAIDNENIVSIYNTSNGSLLEEVSVLKSRIKGVEIDSDDKKLIIFSTDSIVVLLLSHLQKYSINRKFISIPQPIGARTCGKGAYYYGELNRSKPYIYNHKNNTLAYCSTSGFPKVIKIESDTSFRVLKERVHETNYIMCNTIGGNFIVSSGIGGISVINRTMGTEKKLLDASNLALRMRGITSSWCDYNSTTNNVVFVHNGVTRIWDAKSLKERAVLHDNSQFAKDVENKYCEKKQDCSVTVVYDSITEVRVVSTSSLVCTFNEKYPFSLITYYYPKLLRLQLREFSKMLIYDLRRNEHIVLDSGGSTDFGIDISDAGHKIWIEENGTRIYDGKSGVLRQTINHGLHPSSVKLNNAGTLLTYTTDKQIHVYKCGDTVNAKVWILEGHEGKVNNTAFDRSNKYMASFSEDSTTRVWDIVTGKTIRIIQGQKGSVYTGNFNRKGNLIVTGGSGGIANVWNVSTGELFASLNNNRGYITTAYFSDDDKKIITHSGDGVTRVYDVTALPQ